MHRRLFLKACASVTAGVICPPVFATTKIQPERKLSFQNLHTGETVNTTYWAEGQYLEDALIDINRVLRDHRTDEIYPVDTSLLDLLHDLQLKVDNSNPFSIISGYRSPATNKQLSSKSSGVAKRSLHMQGKAIDIRLPGLELDRLHKAALAMQQGGVGYYPRSNFIHVDTGRVRYW